jgi:hypothetical protein
MGLDLTLSRSNSQPLGSRDHVIGVLLEFFPDAKFWWMPPGKERIKAFRENNGSDYPGILREYYETKPAEYIGHWQGPRFFAEFYLGEKQPIVEVGLVLRGQTQFADEVLQRMEDQHGWLASWPSGSVEDFIASVLKQ